MTYEEELRAKLDAVRPIDEVPLNVVTTKSQEEKILDELKSEFLFGQYDLDESDILRTLKILDILKSYEQVFKHKDALKVFYILCRVDVITARNLHHFCQLELSSFKTIINAMARNKLLKKNQSQELELTLEGKSLAERMGIDIFL